MPGAETSQAWARGAEGWHKHDATEARLTRPVSERMLDLGAVLRGARVLDVACGRGEPAIPAAHRVGETGSVLGLDQVEDFVVMARERARVEGLFNIELRVADAECFEVEAPFDVATSRWGLIYVPSPERALGCIRRALKLGGSLVLASWVEPMRVAYAELPERVLARYRAIPASDALSTFRHADLGQLEALLESTGFRPVRSEEMEVPVMEAPDGDALVQRLLDTKGRIATLSGEMPEEAQRAWRGELAREIERYRVGDVVQLGGVTRLTLATAV